MDTNNNPSENFIYYLERLLNLVDKISRFSNHNPDILNACLIADMLPLNSQIATSTNFALRACCPLAGRAVVSFMQNTSSFEGLTQGIRDTIDYLKTISAEEFNRPNDEVLRERAGFTEVALPREKFLHAYALPNFYFHLSMVYAIARSHGVPLSKGDFDGYHIYPEGFSFVTK
ncbi:hypothetical protein GCM10011613_01290 [Cellvibrio zantedeschiae]|uniref:DUF1993 domain-containing protein n=1 Tax=Cellvibrio zantedeschiae TaxID=1237077 RepID=A0ABQ3AM75_9GAMM|nr:DUF1993 domain-containing protein [Cellvibrio zantedeschiae]GGY61617.1 hypothetical protein GCM10011613_01290 [Cellvibrio zantedeschiae]